MAGSGNGCSLGGRNAGKGEEAQGKSSSVPCWQHVTAVYDTVLFQKTCEGEGGEREHRGRGRSSLVGWVPLEFEGAGPSEISHRVPIR